MTHRTDLATSTTMVVVASRGLGRGIATAFAQAGAPVIAVARSETALNDLARAVSGIHPEVADAGDPSAVGRLPPGIRAACVPFPVTSRIGRSPSRTCPRGWPGCIGFC